MNNVALGVIDDHNKVTAAEIYLNVTAVFADVDNGGLDIVVKQFN
jgi:hypothetical protein